MIVAHEASHSWTGNLVTNRTWEEFWLNEGFTTYLERKIVAKLYGEKERHLRYISECVVPSNYRFACYNEAATLIYVLMLECS